MISIAASVLLGVSLPPIPKDVLPTPEPGMEWKLVWSDEFNGNKLDDKKWEVPEYKRRDAFWSRKAIEVKNGQLNIKTLKGEDGEYYDACARTKGRFEHTYGYYVARIKLQKSPGHWSAFWLYNDSQGNLGEGGVNGVEIDIMEKPWLDDRINMALHWDGYGPEHKSTGKEATIAGIREGWHTYALNWTPNQYIFYVDGKEVWRTDAGGICTKPLYIKLSDELELKGWAGDLDPTKLPDQFSVDYVRVYDLTSKP